MMFPEIARTKKGVAMMKPFAISTIMKNGIRAPMFEAPSGSPSSARSARETPVIVANTPATTIGYIAKEISAESQRAK